ncbi:tricarboxylate transporter [Enterovibrio norvegicus]|uniref:TctA family transporter n=1 Tax=Enterovibrio norvegicus DSM 15893 TaxID=1121869 RepID=A0A1I5LQL7_9GAMM|nr:tripartite tricarboxylate transporter permease [Enterovibrio norvegicus]MCC4798545.1 tripartite tricarboxylate transporter permease [Enterovibrio norvegicus]OEE63156.1 tricarboxylate transporter [Enterovibrio norvegicus]OEF48961.1 tricarboxylate transporter [Enterovibrio norvegicus]PMH65438.1 tricarboxylate transporter [Enterovibrio norvegicus]PMI33767.1 tricarboxylate transporter [Enterovibrio norvegicus]
MFNELLESLQTILSLQHISYMLGGVALGLAIGIFPGLGGIAGLSLLLPFLYGMDPISALAMLIGLVAVIPTSDTFTSVLMGIPGSSGSQATVLDGFPMAKKGQAARALSAAFTSSLFGGLFGAVILTGFVLIARPVILAFGSGELFMLTILGLSMVGALAGNSFVKGLSACGLGVLLGSVGSAPATGENRMVFDNFYLMDGLPLVVVGLGIFALPEIIDLLRQNKPIANASKLGSGWMEGIKDFLANKWLAVRCSVIGCIIGALPGLGGSVVDWIAYGHAVQTTKDKPEFGHGDVRGVIAPESSNNAKEGGGLVPTLLFGIPGSGSMAVFLGGMVLVGLEPGPAMVSTELSVTYTIVWSLALANVFGAGACMLISPWVARLTTIRYALLAPFMVMVICFAAYQATRDLGDLVTLLAIGFLGVLMKRFDWPRPAFLIGFVLASGMETYLYQAVQFDGIGFLLRPGVMIIGAITIFSLVFMYRQSAKKREEEAANDEASSNSTGANYNRRPQIIFAACVNIAFLYGIYDGFQQSFLGGVFTIVISSLMWVLSAIALYQLLRNPSNDPVYFDLEYIQGYAFDKDATSMMHYLYWLSGLIIGCYFVGYVISITVFFIAFLVVKASVSMWRATFLTTIAVGFLLALTQAMVLDLPIGLLQEAIALPWPIG